MDEINLKLYIEALAEKKRLSKIYKILKPVGTFSSDYTIKNGKLYTIFEYEDRVEKKFVANTTKTNNDWKTFDIKETETHYIINLND